MEIRFHIGGLNVHPGSRHRLELTLRGCQPLIPVSAAAVVLDHCRDELPAFRTYVSLAVPGPDIHAEARNHTLEAAWLKVATALRGQIGQRKARPDARGKRNGHRRAGVSRLPCGLGAR